MINPASFAEFVAAYNDGSIADDVSWRAYDIPALVSKRGVLMAIREIGFKTANYCDFAAVAAAYELGSAERAKHLLGLWRAWAQIALGRRRRALKLRKD